MKRLRAVRRSPPRLRQTITEANAAKAPLLERQLAELSAALFPVPGPAGLTAGPGTG